METIVGWVIAGICGALLLAFMLASLAAALLDARRTPADGTDWREAAGMAGSPRQ